MKKINPVIIKPLRLKGNKTKKGGKINHDIKEPLNTDIMNKANIGLYI